MLKNSVNSLVVSSNEAIEFKLGMCTSKYSRNKCLVTLVLTLILVAVRQVADIDNDECTFRPVMSHQVFGDRWVRSEFLKFVHSCIRKPIVNM
jgi:hypothetical protein